ncbi:nuclear valosin-containing protein-like isoform X2 [Stegodyphus dumicola]|uniref:nuclear valosin-containing protein-like isoform X2 n=1 Tax=Stegodyphus dumicola TaxID=202533 RepID=UPI0015AE9FE3|nr:nuclear valosin-containing protein-like isoform X2 [Stegodyphus dumicola]
MVRKRGLNGLVVYDRKKRRQSGSESVLSPNPAPESKRNLLNESLLRMYKQNLPEKNFMEKKEGDCADNTTAEKQTLLENKESESVKTSTKGLKKSERKKTLTVKLPSVTFEDVGGLDKILKNILKLFIHIKDPQLFEELGVRPVRGVLLRGPPGCGKTHLARAIAGEMQLPFLEVAATELVSGISGQSESKIRDIFDEAIKSAPCILFIDEIDAVCPKRDTSDRGMERRMVAQFLKCLDELNEKDITSHVMVIGATNRPDSIDPALRRGGRFDRELAIGMPDEKARYQILQVLCKKLKLSPDFDFHWLAHRTPGYVGADLKSLITEAVEVGIWRMYKKYISFNYIQAKSDNSDISGSSSLEDHLNFDTEDLSLEAAQFWFKSNYNVPEEERKKLYFQMQDFQVALQNCVPYCKREGFATVPYVTWDDIGALEDIKKQLQDAIKAPVENRELYEKIGISSPKGILLYGPKGCGKTLLAKAIANECSINFLSVKGPELLNMYLGESEKAVRQCFQRARDSAPCVIFFDEFDALAPKRSSSNMNAAAQTVVTQLLTEMDGIGERKQVFVIGATNRIEKIDSAILRPGRLGIKIFVDIPAPEGRASILKSLTKNKTKPKIADEVDLKTLSLDPRCENFRC